MHSFVAEIFGVLKLQRPYLHYKYSISCVKGLLERKSARVWSRRK